MVTSRNIHFGSIRAQRVRKATVSMGLVGSFVVALAAAPAQAGVGVAVALDLPSPVKTGARDLDGTITIANFNNFGDAESNNLVYGITLTPSCGSREISGTCPNGSEDPRVFSVDPIAMGRPGSACEGVIFTVSESDTGTGELEFTPPDGHVLLAPAGDSADAERCIIDFSLTLAARPAKDSTPIAQKAVGRAIETSAYVNALAVTEGGMRLGAGGSLKTLRIE